jgi:hypothetical protein
MSRQSPSKSLSEDRFLFSLPVGAALIERT